MLDVLNHLKRAGKKTLGERIVDEKVRYRKQLRRARMFGPIPLQSSKVIRIAQFAPQLLENSPILPRPLGAELTDEVALQICRYSVVIQQRVVYVEQEDDASGRIIALVH